jgi:hypothetical protein
MMHLHASTPTVQCNLNRLIRKINFLMPDNFYFVKVIRLNQLIAKKEIDKDTKYEKNKT